MCIEKIAIGKLYDNLLKEGYEIQYKKDYELIIPKKIEIHTIGNKYVKLLALSRHKTNKNLIKITCKSSNCEHHITVTTDHVCMVYNEYNFFENKSAKELKNGDVVSVYDEKADNEVKAIISNIENLGTTTEYVYDCEVDDDNHSFYCNDTLIHNSQFVSIRAITDDMITNYNLPKTIMNWSNEDKLRLWEKMNDFVKNTLNKFVQDLTQRWCHTEHPEVLTYALEYIGDSGVYESKKHYGVRKILEESAEVITNKIKYSGIELKKASIPKKIKEYLGEIYNSALTKDWNDTDFKNYILKIYPEFEKLDINDIAIWKGYNTSRQATGFLKMEKGTTGIAKAATFYNQLISKQGLNIASKYDSIRIGDKVRVCYIKPTNKYNIDVIAFNDGQYPDEFKEIFQVDYEKMFDKLIKSPLKNFLIACKWKMCDPNNCNIMDIDDL